MNKACVVVMMVVMAFGLQAQQTTTSPYSFYGIGSLKFRGTAENLSMGGISVYTDSIHVNLRNPASLADNNVTISPFDGESRPVKIGSADSRLNRLAKFI